MRTPGSYGSNRAVTLISALKSFETGQPVSAAFTAASNFALSAPGTRATRSRWLLVIAKPSGSLSSVMVAVVSSLLAVMPALPSCAESAIVKQPACAAARSSSGLVPTPFSNLVLNEYCVCFSTPLSVEMVPFPSFKPPCQTADALRCMASLLLSRSFFLNPQNSIPVLLGRVYSENDLAYRDANVIKIIGRNGEPIFMQCENITFYGFANILNGVLFCFSLADTSGKPRTFCDPVANLTGIEDYP